MAMELKILEGIPKQCIEDTNALVIAMSNVYAAAIGGALSRNAMPSDARAVGRSSVRDFLNMLSE